MSNTGIALPPGATLVDSDSSSMALPPGASLVSGGTHSPTDDSSLWGKIKSALAPRSPDETGGPAFAAHNKAHPNQPVDEIPGSTEGHGMLEGLADYDKASGGEIGGGVHDIYNGRVAKGLHRLISGFMAGTAPAAAMVLPAVAAASPVTTALGVGGGILGQKGAHAGAEALGATPDQADLVGDVGSFAGGYAGSKVPNVAARAALLGRTPEEAYQSALKPSTTIPPAKVQKIVQTGIKNEIPVSEAGSEKLQSLLEDLQDKVTQEIGNGKGRTVDPNAVANRTDSLKKEFANQVNPDADLKAIDASKEEFLRNNGVPIPAADAQAMKVGTYKQLGNKAYGELGSATMESQKALARGIKEELEIQFPELHDLNAAEGSLYDLKPVLEKAIQRQGNHQLLGIGTPIVAGATKAVTKSSGLAAVAAAIKAVVDNPVVKSHLAIALDKAGVSPGVAQSRIQSYVGGLAASSANDEQSEHQGTQSTK